MAAPATSVVTDPDATPGGKAAWTAAALLLFVALCGAVLLAEWPLWGVQLEAAGETTVEPVDGGTGLWPYTARERDVDERTLGINVVVVGDTDRIRRSMVARTELERNGSAAGEGNLTDDAGAGRQLEDGIGWGDTTGADRYTRIAVDGDRRWTDESYQLHAGTYLGQRLHVRAYEDPDGEWTAMQAHTEHWDWFRLRHTVTGVTEAQREVERDFMGARFVDGVARRFYDNPTADSEGWATVVRLSSAPASLLGLAAAARLRDATRRARRLVASHGREASVGALLFGTYLGVRAAGVGLELLAPELPPKLIAAPLYLLLVVGLPAVCYRLGRGSDPTWAGTHAVGGLGTAFLVDFALMEVSVLPLRFALHRVAVVLALGLVAAGSAAAAEEESRAPLFAGVAGWLAALVLPLFGYI